MIVCVLHHSAIFQTLQTYAHKNSSLTWLGMDNYAFIFQGGGGGEGREDSETSYPVGPEIACTMLLQTVLPHKKIVSNVFTYQQNILQESSTKTSTSPY